MNGEIHRFLVHPRLPRDPSALRSVKNTQGWSRNYEPLLHSSVVRLYEILKLTSCRRMLPEAQAVMLFISAPNCNWCQVSQGVINLFDRILISTQFTANTYHIFRNISHFFLKSSKTYCNLYSKVAYIMQLTYELIRTDRGRQAHIYLYRVISHNLVVSVYL